MSGNNGDGKHDDKPPDKKAKSGVSPINGVEPPREHRFKPGQSGNPGGRRKGVKSITATMRRMLADGLEGKDLADAMSKMAFKHALKGDFRYFNMILDRLEGKPSENIDDAPRLEVNVLPDQDDETK